MTIFAPILLVLMPVLQAPAQGPVKKLPILLEYHAAPNGWEALAADSDVVAVVQLNARNYMVIDKKGIGRNPATRFTASVIEVLKAPTGISNGSSIDIFRMGGLMETAEGQVAFEDHVFPPWRPNMTLLVFLKWSEYHGGYIPMYGPDGAYELDPTSRNVRTFGRGPTAKAKEGRPFADVVAEVREKIR